MGGIRLVFLTRLGVEELGPPSAEFYRSPCARMSTQLSSTSTGAIQIVFVTHNTAQAGSTAPEAICRHGQLSAWRLAFLRAPKLLLSVPISPNPSTNSSGLKDCIRVAAGPHLEEHWRD